MKKLILTLCMLAISLTFYGQKIILDKMENDSIRVIESENIMKRKFTDTVIWNYGIKSYHNINTNETLYMLMINLNATTPITIKKDGKFLIKLFNGEIIELNTFETVYNDVTLGYSYQRSIVGNIGVIKRNKVTRNIATFVVTKEELSKLNEGINKVRVETALGYLQREYKKDDIGMRLFQAYINIQETLENKQAPTMYDSF